jgi:NOL1/NOP2/sun family putative RNA methylase
MERYRGIIPEWDLFLKALERPLPPTIRANTIKISPEELKYRLERKGAEVLTSEWCDVLMEVHGIKGLGNTLEHWLGFYYVQEASSLLPVIALDPKPGERILDMCAAPGGKATYIAAKMENRGALVANEPSADRIRGLTANIYRMGAFVAMVTQYDGTSFPKGMEFDKILLDVPCSCEGTARKEPWLKEGASLRYILKISSLQRRLISKALDLLSPGGLLVYSTCTFAPEENEDVVAYALRKRDDVHLEEVVLPVDCSRGITEWNGKEYGEDMRKCARIYPHQLDSGGGFIAKIRRGK